MRPSPFAWPARTRSLQWEFALRDGPSWSGCVTRSCCRGTVHWAEQKEARVALNGMQEELCHQDKWDFSDLRAIFINCTLKRSPELSHTQGLIDISSEIMGRQGVAVEEVRAIDLH